MRHVSGAPKVRWVLIGYAGALFLATAFLIPAERARERPDPGRHPDLVLAAIYITAAGCTW